MTPALLTWLWQGSALALMLSIALHLLPRVNAATRYVLWWGALAALVVLGWQSLPAAPVSGAIAAAPGAGLSYGSWLAIQVPPLPVWALSFLMMAWASVACFRLLRIVPALHALYRLRTNAACFQPEWRSS